MGFAAMGCFLKRVDSPVSALTNGQYQQLIESIGDCLVNGQQSAIQQVNRTWLRSIGILVAILWSLSSGGKKKRNMVRSY